MYIHARARTHTHTHTHIHIPPPDRLDHLGIGRPVGVFQFPSIPACPARCRDSPRTRSPSFTRTERPRARDGPPKPPRSGGPKTRCAGKPPRSGGPKTRCGGGGCCCWFGPSCEAQKALVHMGWTLLWRAGPSFGGLDPPLEGWTLLWRAGPSFGGLDPPLEGWNFLWRAGPSFGGLDPPFYGLDWRCV